MDEEYDWSNFKIYQYTPNTKLNVETCEWEDEELLNIKSLKDVLPYAAFLGSWGINKICGTFTAHIGSRSFVDQEEEERLKWYLDTMKKLYRKYKRKKIDFTWRNVEKDLSWMMDKEMLINLYKRVKEHPVSAKFEGLHDNIHQYYREKLAEDMVKAGYTQEQADEWVYNNNKTW